MGPKLCTVKWVKKKSPAVVSSIWLLNSHNCSENYTKLKQKQYCIFMYCMSTYLRYIYIVSLRTVYIFKTHIVSLCTVYIYNIMNEKQFVNILNKIEKLNCQKTV